MSVSGAASNHHHHNHPSAPFFHHHSSSSSSFVRPYPPSLDSLSVSASQARDPSFRENQAEDNVTVILRKLEHEHRLFNVPVITFLVILAGLGISGNVCVLHVYRTRFSKTAGSFFITALAVLDMISAALCVPFDIFDLSFPYTLPAPVACRIFRFIEYFTTVAAGLTLTCVAFSRYFKIVNPFHCYSAGQARSLVIVMVVMALSVCWPQLVLSGARTVPTRVPGVLGKDCNLSDHYANTVYPLIFYSVLLALFFLCFAIMVGFYVRIISVVWKRSRTRIGERVPSDRSARRKRRRKLEWARAGRAGVKDKGGAGGVHVGGVEVGGGAGGGDQDDPKEEVGGGKWDSDTNNMGRGGERNVDSGTDRNGESDQNGEDSEINWDTDIIEENERRNWENEDNNNRNHNKNKDDNREGEADTGSHARDDGNAYYNTANNVPPNRDTSDDEERLRTHRGRGRGGARGRRRSSDEPRSPVTSSSINGSFSSSQLSIISTIYKPRRWVRPGSIGSGGGGVHGAPPIFPAARGRRKRRRRRSKPPSHLGRTTRMLGLVTAVALIGHVPFLTVQVVALVGAGFQAAAKTGYGEQLAFQFCLKSHYLSSAANPLIYSALSPSFRKESVVALKKFLTTPFVTVLRNCYMNR